MVRTLEKELLNKIHIASEALRDAQELLKNQVNGWCETCKKPGMYCIECSSADDANNNIQDAIDKINDSFSHSSLIWKE